MVTIKQIAKTVGVSSATVSRVLNYDPSLSISTAKRQAIIETAEALNYETPRKRNRNQMQGQVILNAHARIAVLHFLDPADELADPYYVGVRLGIESRCRELNIEISKFYPSESLSEPALFAGAAGVLAIGKHGNDEIDWLRKHARHVVFADFDPKVEGIDCAFSDLGTATRKMLDALKTAGYGRIAFVGSYERINGKTEPFGEQRCAAYIDWQKANGSFDPALLALCDCHSAQNLRLEAGYDLARGLLALETRPDVIVSANDNMAIGIYRAVQELGLSIPDDIALMSFNDIPVAQFLTPPLTTLKIHGEHIGETAVDLLLERMSGREFGKQVRISTELVWRDSCRRPNI